MGGRRPRPRARVRRRRLLLVSRLQLSPVADRRPHRSGCRRRLHGEQPLTRLAIGADRTIDELVARGLAFTGTRKSTDPPAAPPSTVIEAKGVRVAWIACTYSTNGIPDNHAQVTHCYTVPSGATPNPALL